MIKKINLLLIILLMVLINIGCNKTNNINEIINLEKQEIFLQKEDTYFVFFYKDNCNACEAIKSSIIYYNEISKNNDLIPIYGVNLSSKNNKIMYEEYKGENGQGNNGTFFINNVTKYEDLMVGATPALIKITKNEDIKTATFLAHGLKNVESALKANALDLWER